MSFLCVACAVVCAAFLDGACAAGFGPWEQNAFYFGLCHSEHTGYRTKKFFNLPEILIPPNETDYTLYIPDLCEPEGFVQAGVVVTVCDLNAPPNVTLTSVSQVSVQHRYPGLDQPATAATCHIKEYCDFKIDVNKRKGSKPRKNPKRS